MFDEPRRLAVAARCVGGPRDIAEPNQAMHWGAEAVRWVETGTISPIEVGGREVRSCKVAIEWWKDFLEGL